MKIADEPLSPATTILSQPEMTSFIHCILGFSRPIDVASVKSAICSSLLRVPRFHCVAVTNPKTGAALGWRRVPSIDLDHHVIVVRTALTNIEGGEEDALNQYVADMCTEEGTTLTHTDRPMWEVHVLEAHKCVVLRFDHALGDGMSIMSLLWSSFRKGKDDSTAVIIRPSTKQARSYGGEHCRLSWWSGLQLRVEVILNGLWVRNRKTFIGSGEGIEQSPPQLATASFLIQDMKLIKLAVPNATINDVLITMVSSGLSRYLEQQSTHGLPDEFQLACQCMVNTRNKQGLMDFSDATEDNFRALWGNKIGLFPLPIDCKKAVENPLEYLKIAKQMLDRRKKSQLGHFAYKMAASWISLFGQKQAGMMFYRILCNTTLLISNIVGPPEEIEIAGNPVKFLKATATSVPQALVMHMVSYGGKGNLQILAAKDIISSPRDLAICIENALMEMKEATLKAQNI